VQAELGKCQGQLSDLQAQHTRQQMEWEAQLKAQALAAQEQSMQEKAALQAQSDK
jgi:hypothetical protein